MTMKAVVTGLAALGAVTFGAGPASAMPNGLPQANTITSQSAQVEQVRWVCGPWRCWWRPNWYGAWAYYGPPPYWRWHRWHRWHHWY
jgi:hypothetical protein